MWVIRGGCAHMCFAACCDASVQAGMKLRVHAARQLVVHTAVKRVHVRGKDAPLSDPQAAVPVFKWKWAD
eukprot:1394057-Prorocentrum_lima.AAC.1